MAEPRPLNPNQQAFVNELLATSPRNASAAYARAYGLEQGLGTAQAGSRLMRDKRVALAVAAADKERAARVGLTADEILAELRAVVTADPRDLMEYRRGACRFCHGAGHLFQRTPHEYRTDLAAYLAEQRRLEVAGKDADPLGLAFDIQGGVGFNPNRKPNKQCPECHGHGRGYGYFKDSRDVPAAAARLYAGLKETKDGCEVKIRSVDKSVELMMRNAGMLRDKEPEGTLEDKARAVRELIAQSRAIIGTE